MANPKKIKVGVLGLGRGGSFIKGAAFANMELVAVCDVVEDKLTHFQKQYQVSTYTNYETFLDHDMDAVILANYFHEHAPYAIKALEAGKHVMSECAAVHTMAEASALVRAVEKSNLIYMFAENYPFSAQNQEIRRLYQNGQLGDFQYGEGEYIHPDPAEVKIARSPGIHHWRNWIPSTYYCTHSIAPMMYITETMPIRVNTTIIPEMSNDSSKNYMSIADSGSVNMLTMNNGALFKAMHYGLRGHGNFTRIHGTKGLAETCRTGEKNYIRLYKESWEKKKSEPCETIYKPDFPIHHKQALKAGHGGGDFFTNHFFAEAIRKKEQPFLDVYRGVAMSVVGIQGWRSALDGGASYEIPDFSKETIRKKYDNDHWSPDPTRKGPKKFKAPNKIGKPYKPTTKQIKMAEKIWSKN